MPGGKREPDRSCNPRFKTQEGFITPNSFLFGFRTTWLGLLKGQSLWLSRAEDRDGASSCPQVPDVLRLLMMEANPVLLPGNDLQVGSQTPPRRKAPFYKHLPALPTPGFPDKP